VRVHREGYPTLILMASIGAVLNIGVALLAPSGLWVTMPLAILVWVFFLQFFRNPARTITQVPNGVVSPADGTIVAIETVLEDEYFNTQRLKISIYMSALNVHLNRVPMTGKVVYTRYHAGKYLVAFHPKASTLNERNTIVIANDQHQEVLIRQIAGLLARRIVGYLWVNQAVTVGNELGFIKFGSRCDVFVPLDSKILVQLNEKVRGGKSVLAHLPSAKE
jgi:phosphatidylserine decarboxylase